MGKAQKNQASGRTGVAKAGKRSGAWVSPPSESSEKRAGREQGESQFTLDNNSRMQNVPVRYEPFQELAIAFGLRAKPGRNWDTGYRFDSARGRVIVPQGQISNY